MDLASKMVAAKINVDKDRATAQKYGITSLPTILFLNSKGDKVHEFIGYKTPDQMVAEMRTALKASR